MLKKPVVGLLIAGAFLTLACLCCPTSVFPFLQTATALPPTPTTVPPTLTPTATPLPTSSPIPSAEPTFAAEDFPVCENNLAGVLREAEEASYPGLELEREYSLVSYTVSGDEIKMPTYNRNVPPDLKPYQEDIATQNKMWQMVTDLIPSEQRRQLGYFNIFTDGVGESLGAVEQAADPHFWMLEMDIADAKDFPTQSTTLIHELAHLITLNDSQVPTDLAVFDHPDDEAIYDQEAAACPTYFMFEGCSRSDSYINAFFDRFWPDIYDEWLTINEETDQDALDEKLDRFYQRHSDEFVSGYAVTSPEEDIAESFMYFVFTPKPSGKDIAEEKTAFFYDYPELVSLREDILAHLCTYVNIP